MSASGIEEASAGALTESDARGSEVRRGRRLEYLTVGWNLCEGVIAVAAGAAAGSTALVGFGLDSFIESSSGAALIWRLRHATGGDERRRERVALKLVGASLLLLAAYVAADAVLSLVRREPPEASAVGVALAIVSLVAMPLLARAKRRVAARIDSRALAADSRQTDICAYLSALLLAGLALNAAFGWWWADPAAALVMTPIILKEGVGALRGEACDGRGCH